MKNRDSHGALVYSTCWPGGYSILISNKTGEQSFENVTEESSRYHMAIESTMKALSLLPQDSKVDFYINNEKFIKGITIWIERWKNNGWMSADKNAIKHEEAWKRLDEITQKHRITWKSYNDIPNTISITDLMNRWWHIE